MKKEDLKIYKKRLLELRSRLRGDVSAMADVALHGEHSESSNMPIHMAELASENFEQEFTLSILATEEGTLGMIEDALVRIENGTFSSCTECSGRIPKMRLNAIPYTPLCFECANSGSGSAGTSHHNPGNASNGRNRAKSVNGAGTKRKVAKSRRVNRPR